MSLVITWFLAEIETKYLPTIRCAMWVDFGSRTKATLSISAEWPYLVNHTSYQAK